MKKLINKILPDRHPLRLAFHKLKGILAAIIYRFPADDMIVIGVTGTNGKTTTVNLISHLLVEAGERVGLASTVNFRIGDEVWDNNTKQSSQSPFVLQKMLRQMVKDGCKYAVLEVTSHALDQNRVWGVSFDVAVFTNLTHDHVQYHGSFDEYRIAKGKLFEMLLRAKRKGSQQKISVLNVEDESYGFYNQFPSDLKIGFGMKKGTVFVSDVELKPEGSNFTLHLPNNSLNINTKIPGEYNVKNAICAAAVGMAIGMDLKKIKDGLATFSGVPGRFEDVNFGQKYNVIIDYAHNPDSLENLLALYRKLTKGALHVVFGATGGGRDKTKRPVMGNLADQFADYIYLTNDDPYEEDYYEIIDMVAEGISRKEGEKFWMIADRKQAINLALMNAKDDDTVVIAGKGCENVMMVDGRKIDWNDKAVVKEILERDLKVDLSGQDWIEV